MAEEFRKMRRNEQLLSQAETLGVLNKATSGVLALYDESGYPYAVPLSCAYDDGYIYFHCAPTGHKLDAIRHCDKASFCVIAQDDVLPDKLTSAYLSVIAFGRVCVIDAPEEQKRIARIIGEKFSTDYREIYEKAIEGSVKSDRMRCIAFKIEHVTGKAGRQELARRRCAQEN